MILTVGQLKDKLNSYNDDMEVLVFVGRSGRDRKITDAIDMTNSNHELIGIAIEIEN